MTSVLGWNAAQLAGASYDRLNEEIPQGWNYRREYGSEASGIRIVVYDSGNQTAVVVRGTTADPRNAYTDLSLVLNDQLRPFLADAVSVVLDALQDGRQVSCIGHSYGATAALQICNATIARLEDNPALWQQNLEAQTFNSPGLPGFDPGTHANLSSITTNYRTVVGGVTGGFANGLSYGDPVSLLFAHPGVMLEVPVFGSTANNALALHGIAAFGQGSFFDATQVAASQNYVPSLGFERVATAAAVHGSWLGENVNLSQAEAVGRILMGFGGALSTTAFSPNLHNEYRALVSTQTENFLAVSQGYSAFEKALIGAIAQRYVALDGQPFSRAFIGSATALLGLSIYVGSSAVSDLSALIGGVSQATEHLFNASPVDPWSISLGEFGVLDGRATSSGDLSIRMQFSNASFATDSLVDQIHRSLEGDAGSVIFDQVDQPTFESWKLTSDINGLTQSFLGHDASGTGIKIDLVSQFNRPSRIEVSRSVGNFYATDSYAVQGDGSIVPEGYSLGGGAFVFGRSLEDGVVSLPALSVAATDQAVHNSFRESNGIKPSDSDASATLEGGGSESPDIGQVGDVTETSDDFLDKIDFESLAVSLGGQVASLLIGDNIGLKLVSQTLIGSVQLMMKGGLGEQTFSPTGSANLDAVGMSLASTVTSFATSQLVSALFESLDIDGPVGSLAGSIASGVISHQLTALIARDVFGATSGFGLNTTYFWDGSVIATDLPSIGQSLSAVGPNIIGSFLGHALATAMFGGNSQGAAIGSQIGGLIGSFIPLPIPGLGTFIGSFIGSIIGGLFGSESVGPLAVARIHYTDEAEGFEVYASGQDNGGDLQLAVDMANAAADMLDGVLETIGGRHVNSTTQTEIGFGHFQGKFFSEKNGTSEAEWNQFNTVEQAVFNGFSRSLRAMRIEGGNIYMKRAIDRSAATTFNALVTDLGVAGDYAVYRDNAALYERAIAAAGERALYDRIEHVLTRGAQLQLDVGVQSEGYMAASSVVPTLVAGGGGAGVNPAILDANPTLNLLVLDLDGDGIRVLGKDASPVSFDIDGDGYLEHTSWIGPNDGFLVFDRNQNGTIDGPQEMFSDRLEGADEVAGLASLRKLDSNLDGIFDWRDAHFNDVRVWVDGNQNGIVDMGELQGLYRFDIRGIDLGGFRLNEAGEGARQMTVSSFIRWDGTSGQIGNVRMDYDEAGTRVRDLDGHAGWSRMDFEANGKSVAFAVTPNGATLDAGAVGIMFVNGGIGNDYLYTTGAADVALNGGLGDDSLVGGLGHDELNGGEGKDTLQGGAGDDVLVIGAADNDVIDGGAGLDMIQVEGTGNFTFDLGAHNVEVATTGSGNDVITTSTETDIAVAAGAGNDTLTGNAGDDRLDGQDGNDTLTGAAGDDLLVGGAGQDKFVGGAGNDLLQIDADDLAAPGGQANIDGGADFDMVVVEGEQGITFDLAASNVEMIVGGSGNDVFSTSGSGSVTLVGGRGDDTLSGGTGDDRLEGGEGADRLVGTAGADLLDGGAGVDSADYSGSSTAVNVALDGTAGTGGTAAGDRIANVEILIGSTHADTLKGGAGNDTLRGGAGADTLDGGVGLDTASYETNAVGVVVNLGAGTVSGGDAAGDVLVSIEDVIGSAHADTLTGTAGANILSGLTGNDTLTGGDGDDTLIGGAGADALAGGAGTDTASYATSSQGVSVALGGAASGGDAAGDTLTGIENLTGSESADTLTGDGAVNILRGLGGDDTLAGGAGTDTLEGGAGSDTASYAGTASGVSVNLATGAVAGGASGDVLDSIENVIGSSHADTLTGTGGANVLQGGSGSDTLQGGDGNDTLAGGADADVLDGGQNVDTADYTGSSQGVTVGLDGTAATGGHAAGDTFVRVENLTGSAFGDTLTGSLGANVLRGGDGNDLLRGSGGNDTLEGGAGADSLDGGTGIDTADYSNAAGTITVNLTTGTHAGGAAGDTLSGIENLLGSDFADVLTGDAKSNALIGGHGDDTLAGAAGIDALIGGDGADTLDGGAGADLLDGGDGTDLVSYASATAAISVDLANFRAPGGDAVGDVFVSIEGVIGSGLADSISGDANANVLLGGGGDDRLSGGVGADTLDGGSGTDTADYSRSSGSIAVDLTGQNHGGDAEGDVLTSIESVVGSASSDTIVGNSGNNVFTGGGGNDTLSGGAGNDKLVGDDGADILTGGAGADSLEGGAGIDTASYASSSVGVIVGTSGATASATGDAVGDVLISIENLIGSELIDQLSGDEGANVLSGRAGSDTLRGHGGADILEGGAGNDTLDGGAGNDRYVLARGTGIDHVYDNVQTSQEYAAGTATYGEVHGYWTGGGEYETSHFVAPTVNLNAYSRYEEIHGPVGGEGEQGIVGYRLYQMGSQLVNGGSDLVQLAADLTPADIVIAQVGNDLVIGIRSTPNSAVSATQCADQLVLKDWATAQTRVEALQFADGQTLTLSTTLFRAGTAGADTVTGDADINILNGLGGNDTLHGSGGNDIYVLSRNGGADQIYDQYEFQSIIDWQQVPTQVYVPYQSHEPYEYVADIVPYRAVHGYDGGEGTWVSPTVSLSNYYRYELYYEVGGEGSQEPYYRLYQQAWHWVQRWRWETQYQTQPIYGTVQGDAGRDVLLLASGIALADLVFQRSGNDLYVALRDPNNPNAAASTLADRVLIKDWALSNNTIETLAFADGARVSVATVLNWIESGGPAPVMGQRLGGSVESDTLTGGAGADTFVGGAGADTLDGGGGVDTADYQTSSAAVTVDLGSRTGYGGDADGDVLSLIEHVIGSNNADTLSGDGNANLLDGAAGNDTISGGAGNDTVLGGIGDDFLTGGAGADSVDGGAGLDTASYLGSASGVSVDLAGPSHGGDAEGDMLVGIENVEGSSFDDTIKGSAGANILAGRRGNDTLIGGGGADTLDGGMGSDTASYQGSASGVIVNLGGASSGGDAQGDVLISIENLVGSELVDQLLGDANGNILSGRGGSDTLRGNGGADVLDGGAGNDILDGGAGNDRYVLGRGTGVDWAYDNVQQSYEVLAGTATYAEVHGYWISGGGEGNPDTFVPPTINLSSYSRYEEIYGAVGSGEYAGYGIVGYRLYQAGTQLVDGGQDTVQIAVGLSLADITMALVGNDLVIGVRPIGSPSATATQCTDQLVLKDWVTAQTRIETLQFADGQSFALANLSFRTGTTGADTIASTGTTTDILTGLAGNDTLNGSGGNDVYVFAEGSGADEIRDDYTYTGVVGTQVVTYQVYVPYQNYEPYPVLVDIVPYAAAHGTYGGEGEYYPPTVNLNNYYHYELFYQVGGEGSQEPYYRLYQQGWHWVERWRWEDRQRVDPVYGPIQGDGGTDTLYLAQGITLDELVFQRSGNDLYIGLRNPANPNAAASTLADRILIKNWALSVNKVEMLAFADGTRFSIDTVLAWIESGNTLFGDGSGADTLTGTAGNNVLMGLSGNDTLAGGDGADTLIGGSGADALDGGAGIDRADYSGSAAGVTIDLASMTGLGGDAEGDTLTQIEHVIGSQYNDVLVGDSGVNTLEGGQGNDALTGGAGNDTLMGGDGNDLLTGGAGADVVNGGAGTDTASYLGSDASVVVNLGTGSASGGAADGDALSGIENVEGSAYDDTLTGNGGVNALSGRRGDDVLAGGAGADTIDGGVGTDTASYEGSGAAVSVDLNGSMSGGDAAGDILISIENLVGSGHNDQLSGDGRDNVLNGGGGNDTLEGEAGNDSYALGRGTGVDTVYDRVGSTYEYEVGTASYEEVHGYTSGGGEGGGYQFAPTVFLAHYHRYEPIYGYGGEGEQYVIGYKLFQLGTQLHEAGYDRVKIAAGLTAADVAISLVGADMIIGIRPVGSPTAAAQDCPDRLVLKDWSTTATKVEAIEFADGRSLAIPQTPIYGTGNADNLGGSVNADWIDAGAGNDTVSAGDGEDVLIGNTGNDTLIGGNGSDLAYGGDQADNLSGEAGNDALFGQAGDDALTGGAGDDTLDGGAGADTLTGGSGDDTYIVDATTDVVTEAAGDGIDTINSSVSWSLTGQTHVEVLTLTGSAAISGTGNALDNIITGNTAANTVDGGVGADTMHGGQGDDVYVLDDTGDVAIEQVGEGIDTIRTDLGVFTLGAHLENLTYTGSDPFVGTGNELANTIVGAAGADVLRGSAGNDLLDGGTGDDTVVGGEGADSLVGGSGADTASYTASLAGVTVNLSTGIGANGDAAGDTFSGIENVRGSTLADALTGDNAGNVLFGNAGDDTIVGGGGDDTLTGGDGIDSLTGGFGNDTYIVTDAGDAIVEASGEGLDEVRTGLATHTLAANVEKLSYIGGASFVGIGNAQANVIVGGSGDDTLEGSAGNDTIDGSAGTDTARFSGSFVSYTIATVNGVTTVTHNGGGADGVDTLTNVELLRFSDQSFDLAASTPSTITGTAGDDHLVGGASVDTISGLGGADTLDGGAGVDTLIGGDGNDVYVVDNAGDTVTEAGGAGVDEVRTTLASYTIGADVENLAFVGTGVFAGTGNGQANSIAGGAAADTLHGGSGDDVLTGNGGNDTLDGGDGSDTARYAENASAYVVQTVGGVTTVSRSGSDGVDTLSNVEFLQFADQTVSVGGNAINGTAGNDILTGGSSADTISGFGGDDTLDGGASIDVLIGGQGNDVYIVDHASDVVTEATSEGADEVRTALSSHALAANVESLTFIGTGAFVGTGNALNNTIVGGSGNDTLAGGGGSDSLAGGSGSDTADYATSLAGITITLNASGGASSISGGDAAGDTLSGIENLTGSNAGADVLTGNASANVLVGGGGNDTLDGGDGADTLAGGTGADTLTGGNGSDTIDYSSSAAGVTINLSSNTASGGDATGDTLSGTESVIGSAFNDVLSGSASNNVMSGGAGNDTLSAGLGDDTFFGGNGDDVIQITGTGSGNDVVSGGLGNDTILGGSGDDVFGLNAFDATTSIERIDGGLGVNSILVATSGDFSNTVLVNINKIQGSAAGNTITGTGAADTFDGAYGNDTLYGGDGDDVFIAGYSGSGFDRIVGGSGSDTILGGSGDDTIGVLGLTASDSIERIDGGAGANSISLTAAGVLDVSTITLVNIAQLRGSGGADTIIGTSGNDSLFGSYGDDLLYGGQGNDTLNGFGQNDTVHGGAGNDTLIGEDGDDRLSGGDGDDVFLFDGTSWTRGRDRVMGGAGADTLLGSSGDDIIGVATLAASESIEMIDGGAGMNTVVGMTYAADIMDFSSTTIVNVAVLDGAGGNDTIIGSSGNDTILGNGGNDTIDGGAGSDTAKFSGLASAYTVSTNSTTGVTTVTHNSGGADGIDKLTSIEFLQFSDTTVSVSGGGTPIAVIGTSSNDTLTGGAGADMVSGGDGNDTLDGGAGVDTLDGGTGNDVYKIARTSNQDMIDNGEADAATADDRVVFDTDIAYDQLWFARTGNDLVVNVIGSGPRTTVANWYGTTDARVDSFRAGDRVMTEARVQQLVDAMAAFEPPGTSESAMATGVRQALDGDLAAAWQQSA